MLYTEFTSFLHHVILVCVPILGLPLSGAGKSDRCICLGYTDSFGELLPFPYTFLADLTVASKTPRLTFPTLMYVQTLYRAISFRSPLVSYYVCLVALSLLSLECQPISFQWLSSLLLPYS